MKKVGIMTFHFCDNYGAVLQCFALKKTIDGLEDCRAEVVNFNPNWKPKWFTDNELQSKYLKKLEEYEDFRKKYLDIQSETVSDLDGENYPGCDYYVVGSDQVWNLSFSFSNPAYFLDFVKKDAVKISYAASVGMPLGHDKLDRTVFEKYIPSFKHISVREKTHEAFLQEFSDTKVQTVVDPTLLLNKTDYDELIPVDKKEDEKFIFVYFLKHDTTAPLTSSFVNMVARKYNLKVIHFFVDMPNKVFKNNSESFYFNGPRDFLWYIKNAEMVITNSFHGTIFSILYEKPFYTYVVKSMASRVTDLLEGLGLEDRIIRGYKKLEDVNFEIDFIEPHRILEEKRESSLEFLKKALDSK